jgi:hypothetical protein
MSMKTKLNELENDVSRELSELATRFEHAGVRLGRRVDVWEWHAKTEAKRTAASLDRAADRAAAGLRNDDQRTTRFLEDVVSRVKADLGPIAVGMLRTLDDVLGTTQARVRTALSRTSLSQHRLPSAAR